MNYTFLEGCPVRTTFDGLTEGTPSKALNCNGAINEALLSVEGATTVDMTVEACVNNKDLNGNLLDDDECTWVTVALINASTFEVVEKVEDNGAYHLSLGGFSKVRVNPTTLTGDSIVTLIKVD